ncbi:tail fiber protein [Escherichia fergusonii]|uniref:phage tail fiber protein n=1 Tax=Escherichia fergusonii TaxID=564 RepID=UPI00209B918C|nr:tail fiber protein [Escherichia fergusonii]MCO7969291.1 tail fiber protein [Escherichia fergusonii]
MSKLLFTMTDAGRQELVNANKTGTNKVEIVSVGLGSRYYVTSASQTNITDEIKRLTTIGGKVVSPDTIHVTAKDDSKDEYVVHTIGLYTNKGTLFAVYSQEQAIINKASSTIALISSDIAIKTLETNSITFGDVEFINPPATETVVGVSRFANEQEIEAGTDDSLAVSAKRLKQAIEKHEQSRNHPDATLTTKGFVQLSSATDSTSETLAATSRAVKSVMDETSKKAPLDSPELVGKPTTPTAPKGTNNTQIANTAFVLAAIADLVDSSPDALNTLNELAAALGNDPNFATTVTNALAGKQPKDETLTALAGLATTADRFPFFTGNDTASLATLTKVGRDILAKATVTAVIEYLGLQETVNRATDALQKSQNGADIPDKSRFLSNINVYSKGEVDQKRGMRKYSFSAPANVVDGKWYPIVLRRSAGYNDELASRVVISTRQNAGNDPMNNCEFNGIVTSGGWSDRGSYAAGYFWAYQSDERSIHSIIASTKDDDVCSVFYVEARAFPIKVFAEEGISVIVPTTDYTVGQTTYKWGVTEPATECINARTVIDFNQGCGYYCSHQFIGALPLSGGQMSGALTLANMAQPLRTPGGGILANDGNLYIKKAGFEGWIDALFLKLTGGTLTGPLAFQNSNGKAFRVMTDHTPSLNTYMQIWGESSRPTVIELKDEKGYHFYSQRNTDNSITMRVNGEVVSGAANAFRAVYGNYGVFLRNDGSLTYLLVTESGDQLGGWNSLRPFSFRNDTGRVALGNGVDINNGAVINGGIGLGVANALGGNSIALGDNDTGFKQNGDGILDVYANNVHVFRFQNGTLQSGKPVNVSGRVTPTDYGNFDSRYIQNIQLGAEVQHATTAPAGCVVTFVDGGDKMDFIKYKPIQIYINGAWRTITG